MDTPVQTRFYALHYHGGGSDNACAGCLTEAKREGRESGNLVSTAPVSNRGDVYCSWCFIEGEPS